MANDDSSELAARCRKVGRGFGWKYPWFLPPLSEAYFRETTTETETMAVSLDGEILVNPEFAAKLSDKHLGGVICHELLHPMLRHHQRSDGFEDLELFGQCADRALNQIAREMGIELPEGALYPDAGQERATTEELYDHYFAKKPKGQPGGGAGGNGPGKKEPRATAGCGVRPGKGEAKGGAAGEAAREEAEKRWREVAVQSASIAAGTAAGEALARALLPPPAKTNWKRLIRSACANAAAAHGRDDQTFARRNRRSPPGIILPGWRGRNARCAVMIDASGSVSDEFLAEMAAETVKVGRDTSVSVYLVVHDAVVQHEGWVDARTPEAILSRVKGRGGTTFAPAYRAVERVQKRFDAAVHLTDGFGEGWPPRPSNSRRLLVGLWGAGPGSKPADGEVVAIEK